MSFIRVSLTDGYPDEPGVIDLGWGYRDLAGCIQIIRQLLGSFISCNMRKAHESERVGCEEFKAGIPVKPVSKVIREGNVLTDHRPQTFSPVVTDHPPEFQGAEPASQGYMPVPVVNDLTAIRGRVSQVWRKDAHRVDECFPVGDPQYVAVKVHHHPLVRIESVTVDPVQAGLLHAELITEHGSAGIGGINVVP